MLVHEMIIVLLLLGAFIIPHVRNVSEAHVEFEPCLAVVGFREAAVVDVVQLGLEHEVLVQMNVRREAVDALCLRPVGPVAIDVVFHVCLQPWRARHSEGGIPCVGACVARPCSVSLPVGELVSDGVCVFSAEGPVVGVVLCREHIAVAVDGDAAAIGEAAGPSEEAEDETLDGLQLQRADDVFARIGVRGVDALSVGEHQLIVQQAVSVFRHGEEVALQLYALVAPAVAA